MIDHPKRIALESCVNGNVYKLLSRNLAFGVFRESTKGFIGIREKFGDRYLFEEYHWDCGPPFGTANPLRDLGPIPEGIPVREALRTLDKETGREVGFDETPTDDYLYEPQEGKPEPPKKRKGWYFIDTGEFGENIRAYMEPNKALFEHLDALEQEQEEDEEEGMRSDRSWSRR